VLTIKTGGGTPVGQSQPTITAKGGGKSHTAKIKLVVQGPAQIAGPSGTPNAAGNGDAGNGSSGNSGNQGTTSSGGSQAGVFAISPSPSSTNVLQGDQGDYGVTVDRSGGFGGPVGLGVSGLPAGATATFSPASTISGSSATMTVVTDPSTPAGTYDLTIKGSGSGVSDQTTHVTLVVQQTVPFTISGNASPSLAPGVSAPLDLTLTNPYNLPLKITALGGTIDDATSDGGCSGAQNFQFHSIASTSLPLTLAAGQTATLTQLGVSDTDKPHVEMLNLSSNQDACKGVSLSLHYTGSASK
jgi:hypothetical protein